MMVEKLGIMKNKAVIRLWWWRKISKTSVALCAVGICWKSRKVKKKAKASLSGDDVSRLLYLSHLVDNQQKRIISKSKTSSKRENSKRKTPRFENANSVISQQRAWHLSIKTPLIKEACLYENMWLKRKRRKYRQSDDVVWNSLLSLMEMSLSLENSVRRGSFPYLKSIPAHR